ncbi:hypothetical protein [Caulobacter phage KcrB]|nr:hypothetical protein RW_GP025 [Caulobacter phage RW]WCA46329.1 hypothetical protein [Caulobacter phage KcrB]WCD56264.1 hypothetical protein [Caulobacter phage RLK]WNV48056.1 hypothetical protein GB2A_gp024 [Caulobacter phage GB2A]
MSRTVMFVTKKAEWEEAERNGAWVLCGSVAQQREALDAFNRADSGQLVVPMFNVHGWYARSTPKRPVTALWSDSYPADGAYRAQAERRIIQSDKE